MASGLGSFDVRSTQENGRGHLVGLPNVQPNKVISKIRDEMKLANGLFATHDVQPSELATRINRRHVRRVSNGIARVVRSASLPNKRVLAIIAEEQRTRAVSEPYTRDLPIKAVVKSTDEHSEKNIKISSRNPEKSTEAQSPPQNTRTIRITPKTRYRRLESISILAHSMEIAALPSRSSIEDSARAAHNAAVLLKLSVTGETCNSSNPVELRLSVISDSESVFSISGVLFSTLMKR